MHCGIKIASLEDIICKRTDTASLGEQLGGWKHSLARGLGAGCRQALLLSGLRQLTSWRKEGMYVHPSKLAGRGFSWGQDLGLLCSLPANFNLIVYNDTDFMIESISENTMSDFIEGTYKTSWSSAPFLWSEAFWEVQSLALHCIITQPVCSVHNHKIIQSFFLKSELLVI